MATLEDDGKKNGNPAEQEKEKKKGDKSIVPSYSLHPSNNPGMIITPIQLKGDKNYDEWARAIRNALRAKKKLGFVDGTLTEPNEDSTDLEDWWAVSSMLVAWILNTVESGLRSTITYRENVKDLWEEIRQRFSIGNRPRTYQLKLDLAACKQMGKTVAEYYGKIKVMWDELASYEPTPTCKCGGCKCNISKDLERKREEEKVHQFLMGLDDVVYGTVRSNILSMDPLPNLSRVYAIAVQEERHRDIARGKEERTDAVGFSTRVGVGARVVIVRSKEKGMDCNHCGKTGHEAKDCFQVVGYPEWWGGRPRSTGRNGNRGRGDAGASGRGRGQNVRANASHVGVDGEQGGIPGLSGEQWTTLISLLNTHKVGNVDQLSGKNNDWIIDSGASHHMTGDRTSRTLIRVGEECDGIFIFWRATPMQANKAKVMDVGRLWHQRLGHPSKQVLSYLPETNSSDLVDFCDACYKAKQTRDVFQESHNKADDCFFLIHCDLWGPYKVPASCGAVYFLTIVDDFSRAVWVYLLLEKKEVSQTIKNFCAMTERQFEKQVKIVRSDNGTEFTCLKSYFGIKGILHQTSCVGTPQQNGRVERKHRHILNVARALRFQANLPIKFWGECVLTAGYLINRIPSSLLHGKSPYEMLFKKKPIYNQLKVFGCLCYVHHCGREKDKFSERSKKCVFVGYPHGKKGWRVYDLKTGEYLISRDVVFHESTFPYVIDKDMNRNKEEEAHQVEYAWSDDVSDKDEMHERIVDRGRLETCENNDRDEECENVVNKEVDDVTSLAEQEHMQQLGKGKPGQDIILHANADLKQIGYYDSDWDSCPLTRRSLTGYVVFLNSSPISWKTKKQHTISRSSAEAEYRSMAAAVCELKWMKGLLASLGVSHTSPMQLHCDSQAALHIATNPVYHERTKHIEVDCHFVRDEVQCGNIVTSYVRTTNQLADILTKALGRQQFEYLISKLGI